jgi:small conductance mechanosensitive channel
MMSIDFDQLFEKLLELLLLYGPRLIGAIFVWIIGIWIIKIFNRSIDRILTKKKTDASLIPFIRSLTRTLLKVLLAIAVLGMIGIEMTSFIAILGAAGLAIGLALSGTLQNFAGGVIILIFKPFKVGDLIDAQGYLGSVKDIQMFSTIILTPDNITIIIPNGGLSTGSLKNYSTDPERRVDWTFGIAYGDDIKKAKDILLNLLKENNKILSNHEHFVAISELANSSVNFAVRGWVIGADYWDVFFDMNEKVYTAFNENGINIPFPQMDIHLHKNK